MSSHPLRSAALALSLGLAAACGAEAPGALRAGPSHAASEEGQRCDSDQLEQTPGQRTDETVEPECAAGGDPVSVVDARPPSPEPLSPEPPSPEPPSPEPPLDVPDAPSCDEGATAACPAAPAPTCDVLGSACHAVAATSEAAARCHDLGHAAEEAACAESRDSCTQTCGAALCAELSSLCHDVDPGEGPLHECHELGHAGDGAACFARGRECVELCEREHREPVTITFAARVNGEPFECGASYAGLGSGGVSAGPRDLRFFVHDVRLSNEDGDSVTVELDESGPWQARGVALLDFEDGTAGCSEGDAALNATLTGRAAPGAYTVLSFRIGVPEAANHGDPALAPPPLAAGAMSWGWLSGYKFMRAELGTATGGFALHLGATGCSGDPAAGTVTCARPNRPEVALGGFDVETSVVVVDLGALFAGVDGASAGPCHSAGEGCAPPFDSLGLDLASGQSSGQSGSVGQRVFALAPRGQD